MTFFAIARYGGANYGIITTNPNRWQGILRRQEGHSSAKGCGGFDKTAVVPKLNDLNCVTANWRTAENLRNFQE